MRHGEEKGVLKSKKEYRKKARERGRKRWMEREDGMNERKE